MTDKVVGLYKTYIFLENGIPKRAEILTDTLLKSEEDDYVEQEDKKRKRKSVVIVVLIGIAGGIFFTCIFELIGRKLNLNDIMRKILQYVPVFAESILFFISAILKIVRMPDSTRIRQDDEGLAEVTNEQRNMELQLSDEDDYGIFTCWGNGPDGYGTQEQLNSKVSSTVKDWCGENRDNVFDREPEQGGLLQKDKNAISRISESEQPDDSFSDVENRLDFRESIAEDYPKRTLLQLIANDYQELALRLVWHEGVQSTIIYYYGQSILFDFECLKFAENTDKTIKERLTIIAQRYEDIAYVCP